MLGIGADETEAVQTDHAIDHLEQNYRQVELVQERHMARIASIDFCAEHISDLASACVRERRKPRPNDNPRKGKEGEA